MSADRGVMPNLIGFHAADGLDAAAQVSSRIVITSRRGTAVVGQSPPPGRRGDPGRGIREVRVRLGSP